MTFPFNQDLYPYQRHPDQDAARPVHHPVTVVGAGPVGLALAIDLAQRNIPTLLLDDNSRVSTGSRAICFAKRTLEIADRLGVGEALVEKGVQWNLGKVFFGDRKVYEFNLQPEDGHKNPAFINLQQYYLEITLLERLRALQADGAPVNLRGENQVSTPIQHADHVALTIETPDGFYSITTDWLIACDGANSHIRNRMGLGFKGRVFEDNFLIADVTMQADFPTERWFWFDPPFNPGQSALLHKQPDGVWRIDLQLGWDIDREVEKDPDRVRVRVAQMLGPDVPFELEWVSIYTFQCRRMDAFRHGRILFAGDAAHQVSPFGARGANSGIQDADNLGWKLAAVVNGAAPEALLYSYDTERVQAADENILNSTRSTEFITPKSEVSCVFRDAVLVLAEHHSFARPFVNSGRLSLPTTYDDTPLNTPDALPDGPTQSRPGAPCPDAALCHGFLLDQLDGQFTLLALGTNAPDNIGVTILSPEITKDIRKRYLGNAPSALYLIRPDQHIAARWPCATANEIAQALSRAKGHAP
ncbi:FAD-dependent oxidoreductase [Roseovarius phycicola]|uniref:FAD-dependent oxidoreductase n=1 Tax=Roseovarius phycicola TaxID=3080976 RepID=A0ABZ2HGF5_9RHOB